MNKQPIIDNKDAEAIHNIFFVNETAQQKKSTNKFEI